LASRAQLVAADETMVRFAFMTQGINSVLTLVLGAVLVLYAERIVDVIDRRQNVEGAPPSERYTLTELQSLAFGGIGAYLAISALRDIGALVYVIARNAAMDNPDSMSFVLQNHQTQLVGAAVQLIAAVVLLFKRAALAAAWARIHPMGSSGSPSDEEAG
jgi:hypothetical protein